MDCARFFVVFQVGYAKTIPKGFVQGAGGGPEPLVSSLVFFSWESCLTVGVN